MQTIDIASHYFHKDLHFQLAMPSGLTLLEKEGGHKK